MHLSFNPAIVLTKDPSLGIVDDTSLVVSWTMDEGSGTKSCDSSGNGNNESVEGSRLPQWGTKQNWNALASAQKKHT